MMIFNYMRPSSSRGCSRPDACLPRFFLTLALLLGVLDLFSYQVAQAQQFSLDSLKIVQDGQPMQITPSVSTDQSNYTVKVLPGTNHLTVQAGWSGNTKNFGSDPKPWHKSISDTYEKNGNRITKTYQICYVATIRPQQASIYWANIKNQAILNGVQLLNGGSSQTRSTSSLRSPYLTVKIDTPVWYFYWILAEGQSRRTGPDRVVGLCKTNCPDGAISERDGGIVVDGAMSSGHFTLEDVFITTDSRFYNFKLDRTAIPHNASDLPPLAPSNVSLNVPGDRGSQLDITWDHSDRGRPSPTSYDVQYKNFRVPTPDQNAQPTGDITTGWVDAGHTGTDRTQTIDLVEALKSHWCNGEGMGYFEINVRVRATNSNGTGNWSRTAGKDVFKPNAAINCGARGSGGGQSVQGTGGTTPADSQQQAQQPVSQSDPPVVQQQPQEQRQQEQDDPADDDESEESQPDSQQQAQQPVSQSDPPVVQQQPQEQRQQEQDDPADDDESDRPMLSVSLDVDDAEADQSLTALDVFPNRVFSIQIFGTYFQAIDEVFLRFDYDSTKVVYEGFSLGSVAGAATVPGKDFVMIGMTLVKENPVVDVKSLMGTIRFRTTEAFSDTDIRQVQMKVRVEGEENIRILPLDQSIALGKATPLPEDFDGNGIVDISDHLLFVEAFGSREGQARYDEEYDLNGDGEIGIADFLIFMRSFDK